MIVISLICEYTKSHWIICFKWIKYIVCELCLKKMIIKNEGVDKRLHASAPNSVCQRHPCIFCLLFPLHQATCPQGCSTVMLSRLQFLNCMTWSESFDILSRTVFLWGKMQMDPVSQGPVPYASTQCVIHTQQTGDERTVHHWDPWDHWTNWAESWGVTQTVKFCRKPWEIICQTFCLKTSDLVVVGGLWNERSY